MHFNTRIRETLTCRARARTEADPILESPLTTARADPGARCWYSEINLGFLTSIPQWWRMLVFRLGALLDYEDAIEASEVDSLIACPRSVATFDNVVFQPTVRDDTDDDAAIISE